MSLLRNGKEVDSDPIPKEFWSGGPSSIKGDWGAGDLQARSPVGSRALSFVNWEAFGVEFSREDAEKIGAIFTIGSAAPAEQEQAVQPSAETNGSAAVLDTVEAWAERAVASGLNERDFRKPVLILSWRGPLETMPKFEAAKTALNEAWKRQGRGKGRPSDAE